MPVAGDVAPEALPDIPTMDPEEARRAIQRGEALPSKDGKINLSGMTPEEMEAAGFDLDEAIPVKRQIPRSRTASKSKASWRDIEKNKLRQKAFDEERWANSTEKWLMDQDAARRQAEADRKAAIYRSGAKYSPYARGRG